MKLLPSPASNRSAFSQSYWNYPNAHNYTYFGAQYRPCVLDSLSFVRPLPGLHVRFTIILLARLWISRIFTCWVILSNFFPLYPGFPTILIYLGTMMRLLECKFITIFQMYFSELQTILFLPLIFLFRARWN